MNEFKLDKKVIIITGAAGLIGKELCDAFACAKSSLIILDIAPKKVLDNIANRLKKRYKVSVSPYQLDIKNEQSVNEIIDNVINKYKKIDVLINLAAIDAKFDKNIDKVPTTSFENFPINIWKNTIDTNVTGTFIITQSVIRQMIKQKMGNIVNVASTYSLVSPNQALYKSEEVKQTVYKPVDYVVSKSIIPNFTRYLATFYGNQGIRANTIVPHGIINNHPKYFVNNFIKYSPIGRMCDVKEIRGPFIFLASDAASYMTGSTLIVDGGWTAW